MVAHVVLMDRVREELVAPSPLKAMPVVMYTRMLAPAATMAPPPPPVLAAVRAPKRRAAAALAPASSVRAATPTPDVTGLPSDAQTAKPPEPSADAPAVAAQASSPETPVAAAPVAAASAAQVAAGKPDLSSWPADTRLTYQLGGQFRSGPLFGDAQVKWQREGARYEVRAEVNVSVWASLVMTSQGEVAPDGLSPAVYEEETNKRKRRHARFDAEYVRLENGKSVPRPPSVQDTASQFVELGQRFATGRAPLKAGEVVKVWLARPGAVDLWTYDISGPETLSTPKLGAIQAFHLTPRPIANPRGNIYAELWYAPSLQYLPVRIKLRMGEADYIDLAIETIEQR
nr:DUF3108 domain-containing protein [Ramlibacter albus]